MDKTWGEARRASGREAGPACDHRSWLLPLAVFLSLTAAALDRSLI